MSDDKCDSPLMIAEKDTNYLRTRAGSCWSNKQCQFSGFTQRMFLLAPGKPTCPDHCPGRPRPLSRAGVRCGPAQHLRNPDFMDVPISMCVFGPQAREESAGKWSSGSSVALREVRHTTRAHCISRACHQGAEKQELSIYAEAKGN